MGRVRSHADRYNRSEEHWERLIDVATQILLERGRQHNPTIAYSALNEMLAEQTGQPKFDFGLQQERDAIGALLANVNDRTLPEIQAEMGRKVLLSALVWHKDRPDLRKGFYDYARKLGMLDGRTQEAKDIFLVQQLRDIADYCKRIA